MKWFEIRSFIIGFLLSSLGWWLWYQNRTHIKEVKKAVTQKTETATKKEFSSIDRLIRGELFHQSQSKHLANKIFPLDSIFVEPELLAYPFAEASEMGDPPIIDQMIPYLPDASPLSGAFDLQGIHPLSMLNSPENIVLVGELGTGKTTLFASLTQKIIQNKTGLSRLEGFLPFMIHVSEIDYTKDIEKELEEAFFSHFVINFPSIVRKRVQNLLGLYLKSRKMILLIDGMDELHLDEFDQITAVIKALLDKYPGLKILVNASPNFLGALTRLNFYPMVIKGWDVRKKEKLVDRWLEEWEKLFDDPTMNDFILIIKNWIHKSPRTTTPLAWTLKIWSLLSHDVIGNTEISDIESYYRRLTEERVAHKAVEALAGEFISQKQVAIPQNTLEMLLLKNQFKLRGSSAVDNVLELTEENETTVKQKGGAQNASILSTLIDAGFVEYTNFGTYHFVHPTIMAYFAGYSLREKEPDINELTKWPVGAKAFAYSASFQNDVPWINRIITMNQREDPLLHQLRMASQWLSFAPKSLTWRNNLLKQILLVLQNERLPLPMRFRFLTSLIQVDDPTISKIFIRLLSAKSPQIRELAVFGCGALHEKAASQSLVKHLNDPSDIVAYASVISMSYLEQAEVPQMLHDYLTQSPDESLRRVAAESLARLKPTGTEILRNLCSSKDLVTRRAVVFGLAAIREEWSQETLETMSLEDPEWIVRTTAERVLEDQTDLNFSVPRPYVNYLESEWLLTYAAENGQGLSPDVYPVELLIHALKEEDTDIQWDAINYLRNINEPEVTREFSRLYFSTETSIGTVQAVDYNLWLKYASTRPIKTE